jgi:histidine triad (HIT) family protein
LGELVLAAQKIARDLGLDKSGYKLVFNVGRGGGQLVDHLHLHLLGGWGKEG